MISTLAKAIIRRQRERANLRPAPEPTPQTSADDYVAPLVAAFVVDTFADITSANPLDPSPSADNSPSYNGGGGDYGGGGSSGDW